MQAGWYFTAHWDPVPVRRGDALGFRAGADYFADLVAPGLSNSTLDARWITLLSWCLKWSHVAWQQAGGRDLARRDDQHARYAWLRPLELLWVARTLHSGQDTGQLRGRRSIERWFRANRQFPNFAMSPDQFRRYRQVGLYGAYRVVFRSVAGMTQCGDGWTPGTVALGLAELANDSLPHAARLGHDHFENGTKWGSWRGEEARYWLDRGWQTAMSARGGFLPTADAAARTRLPEKECALLTPALFGADSARPITARVLAKVAGARSHADLCDALADSSELNRIIRPASLAPLPSFSRLADTGMDAMRAIWSEINQDEAEQAPAIDKLARSPLLQPRLERLRRASHTWLDTKGNRDFPYGEAVTRLAAAMREAATPKAQIRALARHHREHGGGRQWFREQEGKLVPLVADTGIAASDYRFRLHSLCRLAAQCGVADMRRALDALAHQDGGDEEANTV